MVDSEIKKWVKFAKALDNDFDVAADPYEICYQLGIDVVIRDIENDGYLICTDGCKIIIVSSRISNRHRQRFIAAHELGHFLMHSESMYCCRDLNDADIDKLNTIGQENQANQFASEFLLPEQLLKDSLPEREIRFSDISRLADSFNVSMTMCARKSVNMSKVGTELLLLYNGDRLQWFTAASGLVTLPDYANKYTSLVRVFGNIPKWTIRDTVLDSEIQYFAPFGNQKLVLIPDINMLLH